MTRAPTPDSLPRTGDAGARRWSDRAHGLPFVAASGEDIPMDFADAYALQRAYIEASGGRIAGHKVAATNPTTRATTGLPHPCYGTLLSRDIAQSPATLPIGVLQNPKIEAEIAFRIARDIPRQANLSQDEIAGYIEAVMPAVELADDRGAPRPLNPLELIAENAFQSAVILGSEITNWRSIDLGAIAASITIDGSPAGNGVSSDISGHPLNSLIWLVGALAENESQVTAGMTVMSGCMIFPPAIRAGETATVDYGPYGTVSLTLGAA